MARSSLHNQMCKVTGRELCNVLGGLTWCCPGSASQSAAAAVPYSCRATLQMSGLVPDVQPSASGCLWSMTGCHLHGCQSAKCSPPHSSTMLLASEGLTCSRPQSRPKHSQSILAAGGCLRDPAPGAPPSVGLL